MPAKGVPGELAEQPMVLMSIFAVMMFGEAGAEIVYPNILGHISVDRVMWYWGGGLYTGMGSPFLFSIYCGLLLLALVIGGAFTRPRGGRLVLFLFLSSASESKSRSRSKRWRQEGR